MRRSTEFWGVSIPLFLFGVLMPKGEKVHYDGICMDVLWLLRGCLLFSLLHLPVELLVAFNQFVWRLFVFK